MGMANDMEYYKQYKKMYLLCDDEQRKESRMHWIKCHEENLAENRPDMVMFSAEILQTIYAAERELAVQRRKEV